MYYSPIRASLLHLDVRKCYLLLLFRNKYWPDNLLRISTNHITAADYLIKRKRRRTFFDKKNNIVCFSQSAQHLLGHREHISDRILP